MMLIALDKNPYRAAELVPDRLKFKQLLELGQLICSTGISSVFKPVRQGKKLQEWIKSHTDWTYMYYDRLFVWTLRNVNLKNETTGKLLRIKYDLHEEFKNYYNENYYIRRVNPNTLIFRYVKEYAGNTKYATDSEIGADEAVKEYRKYMEWKELSKVKEKKTS